MRTNKLYLLDPNIEYVGLRQRYLRQGAPLNAAINGINTKTWYFDAFYSPWKPARDLIDRARKLSCVDWYGSMIVKL